MKRKVILVTLLNLTLFLGISMNAQTDIHTDIPIDIQTNVLTGIPTDVPTDIQVGTQTDAFFTYELSQRSEDMSGLAFMDFYGQGFNNYKGLDFQGFTGNSNNDVCVGNGVLMMAATGFFYLINKKRKGNK
ncbi:MAG: hypothetical protein J6R17_03860 [Bacteroidales bacterium]|nr:hypothetical protein [Bacteroidales bacterium]